LTQPTRHAQILTLEAIGADASSPSSRYTDAPPTHKSLPSSAPAFIPRRYQALPVARELRAYSLRQAHARSQGRSCIASEIHPTLVPHHPALPRGSQRTEDSVKISALHTHRISPVDSDLITIIDRHVPALREGSVLAITSKIVALVEGRSVPMAGTDKKQLIAAEADYLLPANEYGVYLTLTRGLLIATAGIDESNSDGRFVLWPADPQRTANAVRAHLAQRFGLKNVGVLLTDSKTSPLRLGVTGIALAHSGFLALNDLVGTPDLFGRTLRMTKVNVVDALATAAVLVMGEGNEQTPLAVIEDVSFVRFQDRDPSAAELAELRVTPEGDLYAALLTSAPWERGGRAP
jgi:putative folate metabolism gamma-glutamate ligase